MENVVVFARPFVSIGLFLFLAALPLARAKRNEPVQNGVSSPGVPAAIRTGGAGVAIRGTGGIRSGGEGPGSGASLESRRPEPTSTEATKTSDPGGSIAPTGTTGGANPNPMPVERTST